MTSLRTVTVLLLVTAVILEANAAPQPLSLGKGIKRASGAERIPTIDCLKDAGFNDAALNVLRDCLRSMRTYGETAITSCAGALAPSDAKALFDPSNARCFKQG